MYHNFRTIYQSIRAVKTSQREAPELRSADKFYQFLFEDYLGEQRYFNWVRRGKSTEEALDALKDVMMRAMAEYEWYAAGCPYFKIPADSIADFKNLSLNVPATDLEPPFNLPTVMLQFPVENNPFDITETIKIEREKARIERERERELERKDLEAKFKNLDPADFVDGGETEYESFLPEPDESNEQESELNNHAYAVMVFLMIPHRMRKLWKRFGADVPEGMLKEDVHRMAVWVSCNDANVTTYRSMSYNPKDASVLADNFAPPEEQYIYTDIMRQIVGVHKLVYDNSPRIVPEVLAKDRDKLAEAMRKNDIVKIMDLQDRAKRRNVFGWTVMPPS